MKVTFIVILTVLSFNVFSQPHFNAGVRHAERMKAELNLNDKQFESIKAINQRYAEKLSTSGRGPSDEKKALREQHRDEVNKVLTPEQQTKWEASRKEHKEHRKGQREHRKEFREELNLSDQQKDQLKKINESHRVQRSAIMNESLTAEQRKEKLQALNEKHRIEVKAVVTAEQYEKMRIERNNRKEHRSELHRQHKK